jgi:hypothetical protein
VGSDVRETSSAALAERRLAMNPDLFQWLTLILLVIILVLLLIRLRVP